MRLPPALPPLLLACVLLASGCTGPAAEPTTTTDPITLVTDPAQGRNATGSGPHLHDYWGGGTRLTLFDAAPQVVQGLLTVGGGKVPIASYRPDVGAVVPQGTAWANATFTWDADATDTFGGGELWVKSAADNHTAFVATLAGPGTTVTLPVAPEQADLPHQVLSAWEFVLVFQPDAAGAVSYSGNVELTVTLDRGHPIPLFPGHPDQWRNRTEAPLLSSGGDLLFDGDAEGNYRCYGGCPQVHVPDDGAVVPIDAALVKVELGLSGSAPTKLGLKFHSAASRDWTAATPSSDTPTLRTYLLEVGDGGDGPYARQSQWEFLPYIEGPVEDSVMRESYTITATALRQA